MSTDLVRVRIDERDVHVPKGTGLVETALAAGIEIPVFCYEPRLGAPIGACRMCLVEVEGMPKLQAACTLTAQDGMVVKTARTSEKAAEGQNATLEFILVNHPLDCPVCDKGGECPLQDLTFRYGPGNTRMSFEKLTFEKPIPISPTISLDRERCILCYRCTRFSEDVSEDGQLVAANRGAMSVITTFEDLPYSGAFTGNVTELCPVGALLPTQYRFEGRPWEIVDVPTVCGLCPVGCNINATVREGKVKRILSRNHPEIDEGWICDKGRFAYTHLRADDRLAPLRGCAGAASVRCPGTTPSTRPSGCCAARAGAWSRALRLRDGRAGVRARDARSAPGSTRTRRCCRRRFPARSTATGCRCRPFATPRPSSCSATCRSSSGLRSSISGSRPRAARAPASSTTRRPRGRRGRARRPRLVRPRRPRRRNVAKLAEKLGLAGREGCGAFYLPETPNGRGVADAWAACCDEEAGRADSIGLLLVSGDEAAADENVRALAEQARRRS